MERLPIGLLQVDDEEQSLRRVDDVGVHASGSLRAADRVLKPDAAGADGDVCACLASR